MAVCFVIMPVSTPEALIAQYGKDPDHFEHVLEHLFVPAIAKAEFDVLRPIAQGADVIHAEIIKNLETADLVLCDISGLNPNVFFELGCRTALNKPVSYVMDDLTRSIPFDTGIINHHTYGSALTPWTLNEEIDRLAQHIRISAERSEGVNMLWRYFGLRTTAHAAASEGGELDQLAYLSMQVEAIRQRLDETQSFSFGVPAYRDDLGEFATTNIGTTHTKWDGQFIDFRDWDAVIADAENDLNKIRLVQKQNERPPDFETVKTVIQGHIKSLTELINKEPHTARADKARRIQTKYQDLLSGKQNR